MAEPPIPASQQVPAGTPKGGGGIYVALIVLLLLAIGGVVMLLRGSAEKPPPPVAATAPTTAPSPTTPAFDPPPPPPPIEDAGAADAAPAKPAGGGTWTPCSGSCGGTASPGMESALRGRAGAARGCYERALRANSTLAGRIVVGVRVDTSGSVCSVGIAEDGIHSGDVTSCVVGMFRGLKVPPPSGGCADIRLPINFTPKEGH